VTPGGIGRGRCSRAAGPALLEKAASGLAVLAACVGLAACVAPPPAHPPDDPAAAKVATIIVIAHGWHTDIGLPVTGKLRAFRRVMPDAGYIVFGAGDRGYFDAPHPTFADGLAALLAGSGIMLASALIRPPSPATERVGTVELRVTQPELDRLADFVWNSLEHGPDGLPVRVKDGPFPDSIFFAAATPYNATYTCNTWTADALQVAGLPIDASGVLFADQVMDQARAIAAADRSRDATSGR
jgi:uncharacterized protein (TIGR02117 family)